MQVTVRSISTGMMNCYEALDYLYDPNVKTLCIHTVDAILKYSNVVKADGENKFEGKNTAYITDCKTG